MKALDGEPDRSRYQRFKLKLAAASEARPGEIARVPGMTHTAAEAVAKFLAMRQP